MAHDGKLLARAREQLDRQRQANRDEHLRRLDEVYRRVPEIEQIDATMRAQMTQLVRITLGKRPDMQEQLKALKEENLQLQMRRAELLVEHGMPTDYLDEIVSCPICRDTGICGGQPCSCLETLYNRELTKELSALLRHGDESFEHFDFSLYSTVPDARGLTPRRVIESYFAICRRFAANYPDVSRNLLLWGEPGLGKTYLSACIAREVAKKGYSVSYGSAASALDAFERQKFSRDPDEVEEAGRRVKRMLSCDLMILDDLGTEMITSQSISALYQLINTRLIEGKKLIINTNIAPDDLKKKYSPQIHSRLVGEFEILHFIGEDIRKKKKTSLS